MCASAVADAKDAFRAAGVEPTSEDIRSMAITLIIEAAKRHPQQPQHQQPQQRQSQPPASPHHNGGNAAPSAAGSQPLYFATGPNGLPICPAHGWEMKQGQYGYFCSGKPKAGYPASKNGQYCGCTPPKDWIPNMQERSVAQDAERQARPQGYSAPSHTPSIDQFEKDDLPF